MKVAHTSGASARDAATQHIAVLHNISWPSGNVTATNLIRVGFPSN